MDKRYHWVWYIPLTLLLTDVLATGEFRGSTRSAEFRALLSRMIVMPFQELTCGMDISLCFVAGLALTAYKNQVIFYCIVVTKVWLCTTLPYIIVRTLALNCTFVSDQTLYSYNKLFTTQRSAVKRVWPEIRVACMNHVHNFICLLAQRPSSFMYLQRHCWKVHIIDIELPENTALSFRECHW